MTIRTLTDALSWVHHGTTLCRDAIATLDEPATARPSRLPGWSRKHVIAHLAANADAVGNLVHWAATGQPTPMYSSPGQRAADIDTGSRRPIAVLRDRFDRSATALATAMDTLPGPRWHAEVRTAQGRTVPASEIGWLRAREVMVHAVDLDTGITFENLPVGFLRALVDDITAKRVAAGHPQLRIEPTDDDHRWTVPGPGATTTVTGTLAALTAYLAGRDDRGVRTAHGADIPNLPAWL